jgi:hypothetical protein
VDKNVVGISKENITWGVLVVDGGIIFKQIMKK